MINIVVLIANSFRFQNICILDLIVHFVNERKKYEKANVIFVLFTDVLFVCFIEKRLFE